MGSGDAGGDRDRSAPDAADAEQVARLATGNGLTIAVAESLTSGSIAARLGAAPGAAVWFSGGVVAYSKRVKFDVLRVTPGPVVTASCAREMAAGVGQLTGADVVVAVTGVGGPDPEEGQPAGTVFLASGTERRLSVDRLQLEGSPVEVVEQTVAAALSALVRELSR